ncbi:MAG: hypothetical protein K6T17_02590 [Fimbriimonadales bacterium]|nr:hypothetical protein [Fimbriimonadales bacterium]
MRALKFLVPLILLSAVGYLAWIANTNLSAELNAEPLPSRASPEAEELLKRMEPISENGTIQDFLAWTERIAQLCTPHQVIYLEFGMPLSPTTLSTISQTLSVLKRKTPKTAQELIKMNRKEDARNLLINVMKISRALQRTYEIKHLQETMEVEAELLPLLYDLFVQTQNPTFLKELVSSLQEVERMTLPFDDFIKAERSKIALFLKQPSRVPEVDEITGTNTLFWWFHKREVVKDLDRIYTELEGRAQNPPGRAKKIPLLAPATDVGKILQTYGNKWEEFHSPYALHSTLTRLLLLECASKAHQLGNALFDPDNPRSAHPIHSDLRADPLSGKLFLKRPDGSWYSPGEDGVDHKGNEDDIRLPQALQILKYPLKH